MALTGRCYCGELTYVAGGTPLFRAQCHCRECQYISGGGPNYFLLMPGSEFAYATGAPKSFTRSDLSRPVTREFCPTCGTHILTRLPGRDQIVLKVGTLDDPGVFGTPSAAIYMLDAQPFHVVAVDVTEYERLPSRGDSK